MKILNHSGSVPSCLFSCFVEPSRFMEPDISLCLADGLNAGCVADTVAWVEPMEDSYPLSIWSFRICAVLRGWRSFWTAGKNGLNIFYSSISLQSKIRISTVSLHTWRHMFYVNSNQNFVCELIWNHGSYFRRIFCLSDLLTHTFLLWLEYNTTQKVLSCRSIVTAWH